MASDVLQGQWKQVRGQLTDWWGKLTNDDVDRINGNMDKLVGALQAKYGYTKAQAQEEVNRKMVQFKQRTSNPNQPGSNPTSPFH